MPTWDIVIEQGLHIGARVVGSAGAYLLLHLTGLGLAAFLRRLSATMDSSKQYVVLFLGQAGKFTCILLGIVTALGTLGVNVSAIVASLGLTGFALGFALKDALSNLLAGIMTLFYQPFNIGDRILVSGMEGRVTAINLRYTQLVSADRRILIPNASLFNNVVVIYDSTKE